MTCVSTLVLPVGATVRRPSWLQGSAHVSLRPIFSATADAPESAHGLGGPPGAGPNGQADAELAELRASAEREGRAAGEAAARAEFAATTADLRQTIDSLRAAHDHAFEQLAARLARLAVAVSAAVLGRELTPEGTAYCERAAAEALRLVGDTQEVTIRVGRAAFGAVSQQVEALHQGAAHAQRLRVVCDQTVNHGCVVETATAFVDATIDGRLRQVMDALGGAAVQQ